MHRSHQTDHFTVFGGLYPAEQRSGQPLPRQRTRAMSRLAPVLVALVVGAATAVGAVAATKRVHEMGFGYQTAGQFEVNGMASLREIRW
jgi:hypothetical protein